MAIKDILMNMINNSGLSIYDKEMWEDLIETLSPEMIDVFIEQIGDHGEELVTLTEDIKKQKSHLDKEDLEAVLEDLNKLD